MSLLAGVQDCKYCPQPDRVYNVLCVYVCTCLFLCDGVQPCLCTQSVCVYVGVCPPGSVCRCAQ